MILHEINPFLVALREKGYKAESNRMAMGHAAHQYWKGVNAPGGKRLYTIEVRMHDRSEYAGHDAKRFGRWGVSYRMWVNHTTSADVDRLSVDVMHETMEVEEWERRCAVLWGAMKDGFLGVAPAPAGKDMPGNVAGPSAVSAPSSQDAAAVPDAEQLRPVVQKMVNVLVNGHPHLCEKMLGRAFCDCGRDEALAMAADLGFLPSK